MNLLDIVHRLPVPAPWSEGDKILWNDADFSARMLGEHLSQAHDAASRRFTIVDRQVEWIHQGMLGNRSISVLDLGCGPGLYTSRLARRGCRCTGIDFSPASIAYASEQAIQEKLNCRYIEGDLRATVFGKNFDLVMFIFGELNVFRPQDARLILGKAYEALNAGGLLVLEPHTFEAVRNLGNPPSLWYGVSTGLFSEAPHLCLEENFWDEATCTATTRYFILEAQTGSVTRYAATVQAYSNDQYRDLLLEIGFRKVGFHSSLEGQESPGMRHLQAITAMK